MSAVPAVLFDLGNVLFCDPWETLLLTEGLGLADRLGLDRGEVREAGRELWHRFSLSEAEEADYWAGLERRLGRPVPRDLVAETERRLLVANPHAEALLTAAAQGQRRVGIASNNTSFWYEKQRVRLGLDRYVDPELVFLSHRLGVSKGAEGQGLLEIAARHADPPRSLLVEDRPANLRRAERIGFRVLAYSFTGAGGVPPTDLLEKMSA
ncbi:HAD family hydrolase [Streptomyces monticola]|uniref:HAD family hydrolase n=1 Tax=Streptomyces monticola TaxID=2666263 RepID=A0ABW2JZ07_9ACTN